MAGRKKLDVLEEKITALERRGRGDALDQIVRALPTEVLKEFADRIKAGEPPADVFKEFTE